LSHPRIGGLNQSSSIIAANQFTAPSPRSRRIQLHVRGVEAGLGGMKKAVCILAISTRRGHACVNQQSQGVAPRHMLPLNAPGVGLGNLEQSDSLAGCDISGA
jgi:hypothetical protein